MLVGAEHFEYLECAVELEKKRFGKRVDERNEVIRCTAIGHHRQGPVEVELRPVNLASRSLLKTCGTCACVAVDEARDLCLHEQLGACSSRRGTTTTGEVDETRPKRRVVAAR